MLEVVPVCDDQCIEISLLCMKFLLEKSSQDAGLFKNAPNMTDVNWLFKSLSKGINIFYRIIIYKYKYIKNNHNLYYNYI